jgi:pimeloyl-ACP methyl ester carboxylesterase
VSDPTITIELEQLRFQFYTQGNTKFWETHTEAQARDHIQNDPDKYQFAPIDPADALAKFKIYGLWIFGGKDIQAPVGLSKSNINKLKAQGKDYEYRLFPELGHNTAFSKSAEPVNLATQWIRELILTKDKLHSIEPPAFLSYYS